MVSIAMAVFPVCLSPMRSSLWPRPIGNMESIARIPVAIGSFTLCLSTMPGASFSMGRNSCDLILPFPSMGAPSTSTTLPRKASPTGTPAFLFVLVTFVPSLISVSRPNMIALTWFLCISNTMPLKPLSYITISPYIACSIP